MFASFSTFPTKYIKLSRALLVECEATYLSLAKNDGMIVLVGVGKIYQSSLGRHKHFIANDTSAFV
jgi:hypothetical protein